MVTNLLESLKKLAEWQRVLTAADKVPDLERRIAMLEKRLGERDPLPTCPSCALGRWHKIRSEPDPLTAAIGGRRVVYGCTACSYTETALET